MDGLVWKQTPNHERLQGYLCRCFKRSSLGTFVVGAPCFPMRPQRSYQSPPFEPRRRSGALLACPWGTYPLHPYYLSVIMGSTWSSHLKSTKPGAPRGSTSRRLTCYIVLLHGYFFTVLLCYLFDGAVAGSP